MGRWHHPGQPTASTATRDFQSWIVGLRRFHDLQSDFIDQVRFGAVEAFTFLASPHHNGYDSIVDFMGFGAPRPGAVFRPN
jgi:hypothetical protein